MKIKNIKGYTLIELLVVIVAFATIAIVSSETIILTLRGTHKAESISKVRQNVDYAMDSMERQLRSAKAKSVVGCDGIAKSQITFSDQNSNTVTFFCDNVNQNGDLSKISSSSGSFSSSSLTDNLSLSFCSFSCNPGVNNSSPSVIISVTANDVKSENSPISATTQVTLRSY